MGRKEPNCLVALGSLLLDDGFVGGYFAVTDEDDAVGVLRDVMLVGDENDGVALPVEIFEKRHDFFTRL